MDLSQTLDEYSAKLSLLVSGETPPTRSSILELLTIRDKIQLLIDEHEQATGDLLLRLNELDAELRNNAARIHSVVTLRDWHALVHPNPEDWWWFLEEPPFTHWSVRFNWLWKTLAIIWLIAAVALSLDVGRRFLTISPDTLDTFIAVSEATIALLAAGGVFTIAGRKIINHALGAVGVPLRYLPDAKAGIALLFLLGLIWLRLSFPSLARQYNERGLEHLQAGRLSFAQHDITRALILDPDYFQGHYNLGLVFEEMGEYEEAAVQYRIATEGNFDPAFGNLARLYILAQDYSQAAALLEVRLLQTTESDARYAMLTNLGWARFGQGRYDEAIMRLNQAIELRSDLAPAHCLIAQAYEGDQRQEDALRGWEQCLVYATVYRRDEDEWISMAKDRLATQE